MAAGYYNSILHRDMNTARESYLRAQAAESRWVAVVKDALTIESRRSYGKARCLRLAHTYATKISRMYKKGTTIGDQAYARAYANALEDMGIVCNPVRPGQMDSSDFRSKKEARALLNEGTATRTGAPVAGFGLGSAR